MRALGANYRLVSRRRGKDRVQGEFQEWIYEGTPDAIATLAAESDGEPTVQAYWISETPGKHRLVVRSDIDVINGAQEPTVEIRQTPARIHKSIFEPPYPYSNVSEDDVRKIRSAVDKRDTNAPTLSSDEARELYRLALQGVQFRTIYQPIIQVTRVAHWAYIWPDDYNNIGKVMTPSQLLSDILSKTGGVPNFTLLSQTWEGSGFEYGYLFHMPTYDTQIGGKSTEVLEYEYGLFASLLYEGV